MTLGVVCGLKSEASALQGHCPAVYVSGASAERAYKGALELISQGATFLVSYGLSGALTADLEPGQLLCPSAVFDQQGRAWRCRPLEFTREFSLDRRAILGSDVLVETPEVKAKLAATYGAVAVDMESHAVARAATEKHIPFAALRAVADHAGQALPPSSKGAVAEDGSVRIGTALSALAKRPWDLPELMALGRQAGLGTNALRRAAPGLIMAVRQA